MTRENLKKANEITNKLAEYEKLLKELTKKNGVKYISVGGSTYAKLISYSLPHIDGKLKEAAELFLQEVILKVKNNIADYEQQLEDL